MLRVVLIDETPERAAMLQQALVDHGYDVVARLDPAEDLAQRVAELAPDIILVDMDSPSRDVLEHVRSISRDQPRPIVMFAEKSDRETTAAAIKAGVSAYIVDGLNEKRLQDIMDVAVARFREYQALRAELEEARVKLSERKLVDRAKGLLMQHKHMSEDEAYKALRKMAMDRNMRMGEVAQNVIAVMEMLG